MADVTEIIQGRADAVEQRSLVKGFISTSRPAPTAFPTTTEIAKGESTNLLWVIVPEHSTEVPYGPCNWAALHGSTLPVQGAACVVALDQNNKPTVVWWEGNQKEPEYVTALPASPYNGQVVYYQQKGAVGESVMEEQGVVWAFRYHSGSASTHKWEFAGGATIASEVATEQETSSVTFTDLGTVGPSITAPLAGDYETLYGAKVIIGASAIYGLVGLKIGAAGATHTVAAGKAIESVTSVFRRYRAEGIAAAEVLKLQYESGEAHPTKYAERVLSVQPVRVG